MLHFDGCYHAFYDCYTRVPWAPRLFFFFRLFYYLERLVQVLGLGGPRIPSSFPMFQLVPNTDDIGVLLSFSFLFPSVLSCFCSLWAADPIAFLTVQTVANLGIGLYLLVFVTGPTYVFPTICFCRHKYM